MREIAAYLDQKLHEAGRAGESRAQEVENVAEGMGPIEIVTVSLAAATFAFDVFKWVAEKLEQKRSTGTTLKIEGPGFVAELTWTVKK